MRFIPLRAVTRVQRGQGTAVFRRYPLPEWDHLSFSLLYRRAAACFNCRRCLFVWFGSCALAVLVVVLVHGCTSSRPLHIANTELPPPPPKNNRARAAVWHVLLLGRVDRDSRAGRLSVLYRRGDRRYIAGAC